jgi:geranylgeranylglycerol-phosphate geranylgeranyltransferase
MGCPRVSWLPRILGMRKKVRAYIALTKVVDLHKPTLIYAYYTLSGSLLAYFIDYPFAKAILASIAILFCTFGIYTLNDIYDLEEDKINAPKRPLPSGLVTINEAYRFSIYNFIIGNLLAFWISPLTLILTIVYSCIGISYSIPPIRLKRTIFSYAVIGSGFLISTLVGSTVAIPSEKAAYLGCIMFLIVTGCGPLKDFENIEGDRRAGIYTIPIRFGKTKTSRLIAPAIFLVVGMLIIAHFIYIFNKFYLPLALICSFLILTGLLFLLRDPETNGRLAYQLLEIAVFLLPLTFTIGTISL